MMCREIILVCSEILTGHANAVRVELNICNVMFDNALNSYCVLEV